MFYLGPQGLHFSKSLLYLFLLMRIVLGSKIPIFNKICQIISENCVNLHTDKQTFHFKKHSFQIEYFKKRIYPQKSTNKFLSYHNILSLYKSRKVKDVTYHNHDHHLEKYNILFSEYFIIEDFYLGFNFFFKYWQVEIEIIALEYIFKTCTWKLY